MIRNWILPGLLDTGTVADRIMTIRDGPVNFYIVKGPDGLVCVDAGWRRSSVRRGFKELGLDIRDVAAVFLTHLHWDHARCCDFYPNARVFVGGKSDRMNSGKGASSARPWSPVRDGQVVTAAGVGVHIIETPGHTPDSICYEVDDRYLFTGDALRLRRGQAVPFPFIFDRDRQAARRSLRKLAGICLKPGIESLWTSHTGSIGDAASAFINWRVSESDENFCDKGRP